MTQSIRNVAVVLTFAISGLAAGVTFAQDAKSTNPMSHDAMHSGSIERHPMGNDAMHSGSIKLHPMGNDAMHRGSTEQHPMGNDAMHSDSMAPKTK